MPMGRPDLAAAEANQRLYDGTVDQIESFIKQGRVADALAAADWLLPRAKPERSLLSQLVAEVAGSGRGASGEGQFFPSVARSSSTKLADAALSESAAKRAGTAAGAGPIGNRRVYGVNLSALDKRLTELNARTESTAGRASRAMISLPGGARDPQRTLRDLLGRLRSQLAESSGHREPGGRRPASVSARDGEAVATSDHPGVRPLNLRRRIPAAALASLGRVRGAVTSALGWLCLLAFLAWRVKRAIEKRRGRIPS